MKLYRLPLVLREPSEDTEDQYLAEIPALPGCRAWGKTAAQALENLQSVATAFIDSCRAKGDALSPRGGGRRIGMNAAGRRGLKSNGPRG